MALALGRRFAGVEAAGSDEATRKARPWRPVKPLDTIWEARAMSERQRAQRRDAAWSARYDASESGALLPLSSLVTVDAVLSELLFRRRNGNEGRRYVGKRVGGEVGNGYGISTVRVVASKMGAEKMLSKLRSGSGMRDMSAERKAAGKCSSWCYQLMLRLLLVDMRGVSICRCCVCVQE